MPGSGIATNILTARQNLSSLVPGLCIVKHLHQNLKTLMEMDFTSVMSKRTDEDLIKIVTVQRSDYQPEAVAAAEKEIRLRNISLTDIESIKEKIRISNDQAMEADTGTVKSIIRLIHFVVDTATILLSATIAGYALSILSLGFLDGYSDVIAPLLILALYFLYYIYLEYNYQTTLGKHLTKTKVVMADGQKPELNDIIIRTLCRLIPFDRFSFIFTSNGFHDYLSKTTVIKNKNLSV